MNFDRIKITNEERKLLLTFQERRKTINKYIEQNGLELTVCPGCGFPSFSKDWYQQICSVCNWQHDGQDDPQEDESWGGPNKISLTENRLNICKSLKIKSIELRGKIIIDPKRIIDTLKTHEERMNSFDDDKFMDALRTDPIWQEYDDASKEIINDLILT